MKLKNMRIKVSKYIVLVVLLQFSAVANSSLFTLHSSLLHAQVDTKLRDIYTQAESDYQIGRIEQARDGLLQHLTTFRGNQRQNALRLIALCYLARFDMEQTEKYATLPRLCQSHDKERTQFRFFLKAS